MGGEQTEGGGALPTINKVKERLVLSVKLLQQSVVVEVDCSDVEQA
jgi:hypothetical protein